MIYDDAEIRVLWHPGRTDYALITFGDLVTLADGLRFFADTPVEKTGITCIGVVAKRANWFFGPSMDAATPAIMARIGGYATRVIYGGSMGGFGALKHASRLGATQVISLCPQWSVDPAECPGAEPGWREHFRPELAGMGIRPSDLSGNVFVFADAMDKTDRFHAAKIKETWPALRLINVPMAGHHVTTVFAGTENLLNLIALSRADSVPGMIRQARAMRRASPIPGRILLERAIRAHPGMVYPILAKRAADDPGIARLGAEHLFQATDALLARGRREAAITYLETFRGGLPDAPSLVLAGLLLNHLAGRAPRLLSFHGTSLVYLPSRQICAHSADLDDPRHMPVQFQLSGAAITPFVEIAGTRADLRLDHDGTLTTSAKANPLPGFELGTRWNGSFTLACAGKYLSAEPGGRLTCNREVPYEWECFKVS
jgi:hypothetical protein